ncbi:hypothetical protein Sn310910_093 [Cyanophage S-RIM12_Sn_31_0910]|uniref:Major tropism determinant N-terminal domain-containing protein n=2 Tax=Brizovirus TaxID=2733098 RepID=A0A1D7SWQ5_9CAUD|nr:structural protein [Cyanophage S-RIM12 isolate RW_01_0310]AOO15793.1 hypothetical protein RW010310_092 [Cyanophage S-RIM12 isolate RW_01_0310]AOO18157.1 hypothetical protein Sn070910_092 [Cyanophage S-RIM12_Sn_07_0910]AOO18370.1 hypothetical protein Sn310910_093 [Cyanophage S-RIM12_Sn_31_0910]
MANRIQLRRGGAQEWANANPTLAQGELGIELDTGRFKIGDGATAWNTLRYERPVESNTNTPNSLVQRDADGSFSAGTITSTLIGNASTSTRLEQTRQIQLSNDVTATGNFDGSQNLNLSTALSLINTLPHYLEGGVSSTTRTFTEVTVDQKGRVVNARTPSQLNLTDYGLDGSATSDTTLAQPWNANLEAISDETGTGLYSKTAAGVVETRLITGAAGQIVITDGGGISGNPLVSLSIQANVVPGDYNTESLTSVSQAGSGGEPFGTETVNASKFSVDDKGRLTTVTNVPIATATEGSKYAAYAAGTTYVRYDIIEDSSRVYQAITGIAAGGGAPTHTDGSDAGGWRYLAAAAVEQKGLASFAQEDFDVDANGHVTIAAVGVDNTQLQNNRIGFADGNTVENFELDQELTATTGYRGFNYLNYLKVNDTSGNLLVGANNTGDSGAGELDVNVRSYFSDPDITLDGDVNQTLDKTGDGELTFQLTQNTATNRNFNILTTNAGSGSSNIIITAEDTVQISASEATGKVHVEDAKFQDNYIATTNATMNLDPGDDRAVTGLVRVWGNLQIDGTTTTINSTQLTVDDVTILLGGDTVPTTDDNLDRGIEFNYYDTEARLGFYGWDTNYSDLGGHAGGYRFLHAATNTNEVFTGTDSGIIAGNVKLTTGTNSTSNTTGDLVVAGGVGITQDVNIGGLLDVDSTLRVTSTSRFDDNVVLQGASKTLQLNNGSGTTKIEFQSTTGNGSLAGILDVTGNFNINTDKFNVVATSGNTSIAGTLGVTNIATFSNDIDANANMTLAGDLHMESTNDITVAKNVGTGVWEIQSNDYGALRLDGGAYVAGDALIDGTLHVNGAIEVQDSATETESRLNWLRVRYRGRFGDTYQATPSYASHNTTTIRAHGGAGIERTLHVGGTGSGEGLFVGKRYSGDTVKFSVLGASGNTDIQGTFDVAGNSEFNGTVDVDADFAVRNGTTDKFFVDNVTGNTDIQGTLDVNGATEITNTLDVSNAVTFDQTLLVQGNSEFNGTVDVDANFAVRSGSTDKMTVASSSGNIATDGTLVVQGQTTINDSLIVDAANEVFSVRNGSAVEKFGVDADNGNTNIIGTLTVGDATQINDTFGASGIVTLTNNTEQTLTGSYGADGALRLTGGAAVQRNLAVGGAARVYGNTELTGTLDLNNSADISGALVTHDNVTITADNKTFAIQNASAANKFTVDTDNGNTDLRGTLDIGGDVTAESNLTVTGNLTINGTTTTVNSTVTTIDDPIITVGGDTAPASNDGKDRGVEFRYYDSSAKIGFFGYDRSANQFAFVVDATNSSEVLSGTDGNLRAGSLNLTGAGTALDVDANANIDGTLTVDGQIISQVSSGAALVIPNTTKINNLNADLLDSMTTASAATATTVVARDSSGDFAANIITVASGVGAAAGIQGNALTADTLKTARNITVAGVVSGDAEFNGSGDITITTTYVDADITALAAMAGTGFVSRTAANTYAQRTLAVTASSGITLTNADGVSGNPTINVASTASNSANNLVLRDASGDFAAGTITAALVGNVTGQTSDISNHDTGDLSEGSNLYFTNERVDDRIDALFVASTGITKVYDDTAGTYTLSVTQADVNTDNVTEGSTNLFTTAARTRTHFTYGTGVELSGAGALSVTQADIDTDNVTEGSTNIFYTEARFNTSLATKDTDNVSEGSSNLYFTNTRADTRADLRVAAATGANLDLSSKSTTNLSEGTNQYYTEARVQDKLDNAFAQLSAMLNNLATATTLVLNLSGDPTPGDVTAFNNGTLSGGTLYNTGTAVATTSSGSGTGLTVDITASGGAITAVAINAAGSGYVVGETITISTGGGDATINVSAVTEMAIGDTVTGSTSGTTGVITAVGATSVTVDTVNGFFKKTETVSAGDVSTLTITSFA